MSLIRLDGSTGITSSIPHSARLQSFSVGVGAARGYSPVTDVQLGWILEPAQASLKNLDLVFAPDAGFGAGGLWGMAGGGGGGGAGASVPFASALFADFLANAPNLERLALRDARGTATVGDFPWCSVRTDRLIPQFLLALQSFPSFAAPPHNNNFDHALSHLPRLKEFQVQLCYVGVELLNSLRACADHLESLVFLGSAGPRGLFSCTEFANRIEGGFDGGDQFKHLQRLVISGHGRGGWSVSCLLLIVFVP